MLLAGARMGHASRCRQLVDLQKRHPFHVADDGQTQIAAWNSSAQSSYSSSNSTIRPSYRLFNPSVSSQKPSVVYLATQLTTAVRI